MSSKRLRWTSPRLNDRLRQQVDEAFTDPRPNVPAREVFKRLRAHHARSAKAKQTKKI
jgi:hypothetical protein